MKKVLRQSKKFWVIFWISSSILILIKVSVRSYDDEVKQVESWHRNRLVYNVNVKGKKIYDHRISVLENLVVFR